MASSPHKRLHHLAATAAPPPTPSTQTNLLSTSEAADALSRLLHRLPPTLSLSLPSRRPSTTTSAAASISAPVINLSDPTPTLHSDILSAASELGFFQLTHHSVPSRLALAAESNSVSLFNLPKDQKQHIISKNWPLGYDADDDDEDDEEEEEESSNKAGEYFVLDSSCSTESNELNLDDLRVFTREMEKLGLEVTEALASAVGFDRVDPTRVCSLMWISENSTLDDNNSKNNHPVYPGRFYPCVVGLQYQITCRKYSMLADSGWVSVSPQVDSVLVTVGDIAQVWSNGKIKKVRGRAVPLGVEGRGSITMSLLITLPIDSTISPLVPNLASNYNHNGDYEDDNGDNYEVINNNINFEYGSCSEILDEWVFNSFSFEDYAWRVYHERLLLKDPLNRYHV